MTRKMLTLLVGDLPGAKRHQLPGGHGDGFSVGELDQKAAVGFGSAFDAFDAEVDPGQFFEQDRGFGELDGLGRPVDHGPQAR
ncbi:MAG: hypothetical protein ACRDYY_00285 [Acidimicrobiales bacterium]